MHACMHVHVDMDADAHLHVFLHAHVHAHMHLRRRTPTHMRMHMHTRMISTSAHGHAHARTHTHARTHLHKHTRLQTHMFVQIAWRTACMQACMPDMWSMTDSVGCSRFCTFFYPLPLLLNPLLGALQGAPKHSKYTLSGALQGAQRRGFHNRGSGLCTSYPFVAQQRTQEMTSFLIRTLSEKAPKQQRSLCLRYAIE